VSLATSHSRRRTKLHTRVVGSPSGTPIKVACSVLNTVGGPQGGSFTGNERPKRRTVLSVCSNRRREALPLLRAIVVGIHDLQGLCDSSPHLPVSTLIQRCSGGLSRCSFEQQASFRPCRFRGVREGLGMPLGQPTRHGLSPTSRRRGCICKSWLHRKSRLPGLKCSGDDTVASTDVTLALSRAHECSFSNQRTFGPLACHRLLCHDDWTSPLPLGIGGLMPGGSRLGGSGFESIPH